MRVLISVLVVFSFFACSKLEKMEKYPPVTLYDKRKLLYGKWWYPTPALTSDLFFHNDSTLAAGFPQLYDSLEFRYTWVNDSTIESGGITNVVLAIRDSSWSARINGTVFEYRRVR